jgi:hypothetical protein
MAHPIYRLIDISPDLAVAAQHVAAVKKINEESCAVFLVGQSAVDGGFLVSEPWDRVVGDINDELIRAAEEGLEISEEDEDEDEESESAEAN